MLNELEAGGWITRTERPGKSNLYHLQVGGIQGIPATQQVAESEGYPLAESEGYHLPETKGQQVAESKGYEVTKRSNPKKLQKEIRFPSELSSDAFKAVWSEWEQHRREIKKKLTPTSIIHQLGQLAKMGEARAIAALKHSITNGWQGFYEPKTSSVADPQPKRAADLRL